MLMPIFFFFFGGGEGKLGALCTGAVVSSITQTAPCHEKFAYLADLDAKAVVLTLAKLQLSSCFVGSRRLPPI